MEEENLNKALGYTTFAIILGLAMILIPTVLFVGVSEHGNLVETLQQITRAAGLSQQFLDYSDQSRVEPVSSEEVNVLGISFAVASVIYILSKRRRSRQSRMLPPIRQY